MIQIQLSDLEREELQRLKREHTHPSIRLKAEVILLKDMKYSHKEVEKIVMISRFTIKNYMKLYIEGGIMGLIEDKHYIPVSRLKPYKDKIIEHFEKNPIFNTSYAIEEIEKLTGHRMSPTRTRVFMRQIGLKFLKTGAIPAKQAEEKKQDEQEEFKKKF